MKEEHKEPVSDVQQNPSKDAPEGSVSDPELTGHKMPGWVLIVSVVSALVFICLLLTIAVFIPHPTKFQFFVFRIVLALAAAAFGATIPGFFKINLPVWGKGAIYAGGAVGLFVLIYQVNPPELITAADEPPQIMMQKLTGTILDQNSEPLPGVLVTLPEMGEETRSNDQGFFSFEIETENQRMVRLMAQKENYKTIRQDVMAGSTGHAFKMERTP